MDAIVCELMSYTWPARIGFPGGMTSSPVVRTETRGRAYTRTRALPMAARAPTFAGVRSSSARTTTDPRAMSSPRPETLSPGCTGEYTFTASPSRSVSSTMTTASAPRGSVGPVATSVHRPETTRLRGTVSA